MLKMFELAGYQMDLYPEDEEKNRPKTLIELLQEALGNPPEDPGKWIRIADIPRYIAEHLTVPEDLKAFNDAASKPVTGMAVEVDEPDFEEHVAPKPRPKRKRTSRQGRMINAKALENNENDTSDLDFTSNEWGLTPMAPYGFQLSGDRYDTVAEVEVGETIVNVADATYTKIGENKWIMPNNEKAGEFLDIDVEFAPMYGLVEDDE